MALQTADPQAAVRATVEDGGLLLVLDLTGFRAGDKLVFTIDVDEVQGFDPAEVDFEAINESVDPLASGVEFQGSRLTATFWRRTFTRPKRPANSATATMRHWSAPD